MMHYPFYELIDQCNLKSLEFGFFQLVHAHHRLTRNWLGNIRFPAVGPDALLQHLNS